MNYISDYASLVINLHERGYIYDFIVVGERIWWIQENCYLPVEDLKVIECHEISGRVSDPEGSFIYALLATDYNAKGILIGHFRNNIVHPSRRPLLQAAVKDTAKAMLRQ